MRKCCHVISHTHWDREWYEPFEVFRLRLVRLIDALLETVRTQPEFRFHLDAQTIVLDDYLAIRPERRSEVERAIRQRRILVGPWYIQNDFFLSSGESTVRNLLIGIRAAERYGYCDKIGYAPDQFGLPGQLPQIFAGFGIENCIFGRGRLCPPESGKHAEFLWRTPSGAEILGVQLVHFYNNAQRFSADRERALRMTERAVARLDPVSATRHRLLMNGCDHLHAQGDVNEILRDLAKRLPADTEIFQSTLAGYCRQVRAELREPEIHIGELRSGSDRQILQGTLSSRGQTKRRMVRAERLLAGTLEPLSLLLLAAGFPAVVYDADLLGYLWRLLLENLPHDSICGCSCDAVNRHMNDRLERFREAAEFLLGEQLSRLLRATDPGDDPGACRILLINLLPFAREEETEVTLDWKSDEFPAAFRLESAAGETIPFRILETELLERPLRSPVNLPGRMEVMRCKLRLRVRIPAFGYTTLRALPLAQASASPVRRDLPEGVLENEFLRLETAPDGRIDLTDRTSGVRMTDLLHFEDVADFGDSYTLRMNPALPPIDSRVFPPERRCEDGRITLNWRFPLPVSGDRDARRRSVETTEFSVKLELALPAGSRRLECRFSGRNLSGDHCFLLAVTPDADAMESVSSVPFAVQHHRRDAEIPADRNDPELPSRDFVALPDAKTPVAVLHEGMHAYFHRPDGALCFPLLRATPYIQGFFDTPRDPDWLVPENQCPGDFDGRFAVQLLTSREEAAAEAANCAAAFLTPPASFCDSCDPAKFRGGRPCVQESDVAEIFDYPEPGENLGLPREGSFLHLESEGVPPLLTAAKRAEDSDAWIFRFCNLRNEPQRIILSTSGTRRVKPLRMDETPCGDLPESGEIPFAPEEIVTIGFIKEAGRHEKKCEL